MMGPIPPGRELPSDAGANAKAKAVDVPVPAAVPDLRKLTVVFLKEELEKRGLSTKGLKAALVKRLKEGMAAETAAPQSQAPAKSVTKMTVKELKAEASRLGIDLTGCCEKADIVAKLQGE
jgi:hypothetical protein